MKKRIGSKKRKEMDIDKGAACEKLRKYCEENNLMYFEKPPWGEPDERGSLEKFRYYWAEKKKEVLNFYRG